MATQFFAISGPDNVGKTTQLRMLRHNNPAFLLLEGVHKYYPKWDQIVGPPENGWWFKKSTNEEHIDTIFAAYIERQKVGIDAKLAGVDRGPLMFIATCAATAATKSNLTPEAALDLVTDRVRTRYNLDPVYEILLLPDDDPHSVARHSLAKEKTILDQEYVRYQEMLAQILFLQRDMELYDHVIYVKNQPIVSLQNKIRMFVGDRFNEHITKMFQHLENVWLIGGMSESGKSTAAQILREKHGFSRLKFEYLSHVSRQKNRQTADEFYRQNDELIAEQMLYSLDDFLRYQYFVTNVSLESIHRYAVAKFFKSALADRATIMFMETPESLRLKRAAESPASVETRDQEKQSRGAPRVIQIADVVIDNGGDRFSLEFQLARAVSRQKKLVSLPADGTDPVGIPTNLESLLQELSQELAGRQYNNILYACATGSLAADRWVSNWSDVDILLVVRSFAEQDFTSLIKIVQAKALPTKIAFSIVLLSEIEAGMVSGAVLHRLRRATSGDVFVISAENAIDMPQVTIEADAEASMHDLFTAVVMLRRAVAFNEVDVQTGFKQAAVAAKVILRSDGIEVDGEEQAIEMLFIRSGYTDVEIPKKTAMAEDRESHKLRILEICKTVLTVYEGAVRANNA